MRRAGVERTVAVTGAGTPLGRAVQERLAARPDLGRVDLLDAAALGRRPLAGVDTVVHVDGRSDGQLDDAARREHNVGRTRALLRAAGEAGVRRVVLVTSAQVYGAAPGNAVPLPDDAPVSAASGPDLLGDHVEIERLVAEQGHVALLRPATVVGGPLGSAYDGALLRQLTGSRLLAPRGTEPLWQLCHGEDLVRAIETVVVADLVGPLSVGCSGWLTQTEVEQLAGKRRVELPAAVALGTAERLHRLGVSSGSPRDLDHLVGPVVVGSDRLRAAGWSPLWTNESALRSHLAERDPPGRAGAYTAAGATVALLGTAALVRRARRRRGL